MKPQVLELLQHPLTVTSKDLFLLEDEIELYPYFQPLHLLRAKAVAKSEDQKFDSVLNKTATYCANRIILFEYLNAKTTNEDNSNNQSNSDLTTSIEISEEIQEVHFVHEVVNTEENILSDATQLKQEITKNDKENESSIKDKNFEIKETLQPNQNIEENFQKTRTSEQSISNEVKETKKISNKDRHSFGEWLSLTSTNKEEKKEVLNEKFKIIEDFLEKNPKITPAKVYKPTIEVNPSPKENLSHLMTETLAKIYVEQKKYDKAIKAYTILRLKYPEKSGYFADQIKEIKDLKNN